tara:strand:- start:289 stop:396 length:108 start_codon:yes stop_codon:yes gene_type:complete
MFVAGTVVGVPLGIGPRATFLGTKTEFINVFSVPL